MRVTSSMRGLVGVIVCSATPAFATGCDGRDVDATPPALANEVDRCTANRVFDSCTIPTADPTIAALAIDAHELAVAADDISARTLTACENLARTYGVLPEDASAEPRATTSTEPPSARSERIRRACSSLAEHLRARTPALRVEIRRERCVETTRVQCSRAILDVACTATIVVENDPSYLSTREGWEMLVHRLRRRTDETARLRRSVAERASVEASTTSLCDRTAIASSRTLVEDWTGPLVAVEDALADIADALAPR